LEHRLIARHRSEAWSGNNSPPRTSADRRRILFGIANSEYGPVSAGTFAALTPERPIPIAGLQLPAGEV
jgi:hypothetical protein